MSQPPEITDFAHRHAFIRADIEEGLCSIQCAAAIHRGRCVCACRGQNHGKLWLDQLLAEAEDEEAEAA